VDSFAAKGAKSACEEEQVEVNDRVKSVVRKGVNYHNIGSAWPSKGNVELEQAMSLMKKADTLIVVGGNLGTKTYLVLAELFKMPIIPSQQSAELRRSISIDSRADHMVIFQRAD
jgi:hypothetical protein